MRTRRLFALAAVAAATLMLAACGDGGGKGGYPSAGEDRFESARATIRVDITPEATRAAGIELQQKGIIKLEGPAVIARGDPQTDEDGRVFVEMEIVSLELTGITPPLGPVVVRQNPDRQSLGEMRQREPGVDFPADSFFDAFVQIELPDRGITAENRDPLRLEATLTGLPPAEGDEYRTVSEDLLPLHMTDTGNQIARIVDASYIPKPVPTGEPVATTTGEPEATETGEAQQPTDTPVLSADQPQSEGSCHHAADQQEIEQLGAPSILIIRFSNLEPGRELRVLVTSRPRGGVAGDGLFTATADNQGNATVEAGIQFQGTYSWAAGAVTGSFEVGGVCPE